MIFIKKIKPMFNKIVTTCNVHTKAVVNEDGIIDSSKEEGSIMEYQTVIACGPLVKSIKPGDVVVINPTRYQVMKHKEGSLKDGVITDNPVLGYNFPILNINNMPHLYIYDSDVDYIIKEFEEIDTQEEVANIAESAPDIV